jgi:hypothetical protein
LKITTKQLYDNYNSLNNAVSNIMKYENGRINYDSPEITMKQINAEN